jgi:hypothetical protein
MYGSRLPSGAMQNPRPCESVLARVAYITASLFLCLQSQQLEEQVNGLPSPQYDDAFLSVMDQDQPLSFPHPLRTRIPNQTQILLYI